MRRPLVTLSSAALIALSVGTAHGRTNVASVPLECRAEVYQINPDIAEAPRKLDSFDMYGAWSFGAYSMSYDRKNVFFERFHGVALKSGDGPSVEYDVPHMTSRYILWSPDNSKAVMSMSNGTVLISLASLGKGGALNPPAAGCTMLYQAPKLTTAYGGCWAPDGSGYFILEGDATRKTPGSKLKRFAPSGGSGQLILDHPTRIGYFMTPNSWFQDGSGNSSRPYAIVFGASDGFFICDSAGKQQEKIDAVPSDGPDDIEFSPAPNSEDMFATVTRHLCASKPDFRGIHIVRPGKLGSQKPAVIEQVADASDVHTLLFSPKGKYLTFANKTWVKYREVDNKKPDALVTVDLKPGAKALEVNGFAWDLSEQKLAITAGNNVYVHDPKTKKTTLVATVGDAKTFTAEPDWRGNEIIFTAYNDICAPFRR